MSKFIAFKAVVAVLATSLVVYFNYSVNEITTVVVGVVVAAVVDIACILSRYFRGHYG